MRERSGMLLIFLSQAEDIIIRDNVYKYLLVNYKVYLAAPLIPILFVPMYIKPYI